MSECSRKYLLQMQLSRECMRDKICGTFAILAKDRVSLQCIHRPCREIGSSAVAFFRKRCSQ